MKDDRPSSAGYAAAAWLLLADVAAMRAVAEVESGPLGAFLDSGEPVILFERHIFDRLTKGQHRDSRIPGIVEEWGIISSLLPGGYGSSSVQHRRLQFAASLNWEAAMRSASWGLFQILGLNHAAAGYPKLNRFITAMYRSADDHLRAFVMFVRHDDRLVDAIRKHDWTTFARIYNGPRFEINRYDTKMAVAYAALVTAT